MQLTSRYRIALLVVLSCSLVSLFYLRSQLLNIHLGTLHNELPPPPTSTNVVDSEYPSVPPKIQLIAIWSPTDVPPIYLPDFFASVAANPSIDLLFIKYDRYGRGPEECVQPHVAGVPNVREVCLSAEEVWSLHADFFCERWSCDSHQRNQVLETIVRRSYSDRVNSFYRPYRSAVFKRWIHPDTKLWGWCDLDTILGNFDRTFPWDISDQFDVYISGWPTGSDVLMFMPGHLTVFRHSKRVIDEFMLFPHLRDAQSFLAEPWIDEASEESEYSYFLFVQSNLTFVRFDAMISSDYHISSPGLGVYQIDDPWKLNRSDQSSLHIKNVVAARQLINDVLKRHDSQRDNGWRSFSPEGQEHTVELKLGEYDGGLWFPKHLAVHYDTDWTPYFWGEGKRRLTYRREPRGHVIERMEPGRPIAVATLESTLESQADGPTLREQLYNHLQHEKYTEWWSLPHLPFKKGEILFIHKDEGAILWDAQGQIRWRSPSFGNVL